MIGKPPHKTHKYFPRSPTNVKKYKVLEGNPGKIAQGGLLPDHPPSPLFNGDPALHRQCPGRVLSLKALSKDMFYLVLETT